MILLQANQVSRSFADTVLFQDVTFNIQSQDRIALVGRNGAGKSTLIKQIMGDEPISSGNITRAKNLKIGYLEQHVAVDSPLTIWEEMLSAHTETLSLREQAEHAALKVAELSENPNSDDYTQALMQYDHLQEQLKEKNAYSIESDIRTVLHGFGYYETDYNVPVASLSGGQKTRLALAKILLMDYDLLILDEPTNHLDMTTLAWLEKYLIGYKGALLIVSHDRYFLDNVATQVIELRHHTLHTYKGNYSYYIEEKAQRLALAQKQYDQQQADIQKLEDFVQKNIARASTTKRAQSRRKQLEKMTRLTKPLQDAKAPKIQFSAAKDSGEKVIELRDLSIGYTMSQPPIARHLNMDLRKQQAIAIVGPNGVGKTTLLKTILNQVSPLLGDITLGSGVEIGYYNQNITHLDESLSVLETLWQAHDTTDEKVIRTILGSFLFSGDTVEKKVSMLSGGEKARLSLALLATKHDNTLLLDEPTNHLDIDSKEVLEDALIEFDGTLLFVSHDRYFINRLATHVLEISEQGSTLYLGDYDYYIEKKTETDEIQRLLTSEHTSSNVTHKGSGGLSATRQQSISTNQPSGSNAYEAAKNQKRELRKLQHAVDSALELSEQLEHDINALHEALATASQENNLDALESLHKTLLDKQAQQTQALEDWEQAALQLEAFEATL